MTQDLALTIPLGVAIRALEQATSPDEILTATLRLQAVLEQIGLEQDSTVRALTMAAAQAVDEALAQTRAQDARTSGSHPAAASAAAAYRHSIEVQP